MNGKRLVKFVSGAVVISTVLATGFTALAAQRSGTNNTAWDKVKSIVGINESNAGKGPCKGIGKGGNLTSILAGMVKDGTLTQSEADKITTYQKTKQESMKAEMDKVEKMTVEERKSYLSSKKTDGQGLLTELVSKGIVTQAKADAIKAKMQQKSLEMKTARLNEMKSQLGTLVTKGTINQAQADKVIDYMSQMNGKAKIEKGNMTQAEKDKVKNMTEEERKAYFDKVKGNKGNFLKELVDNGTLTQDQSNAISEIIRPQHGRGTKGK
jgi:polyhydroxyalkanoate synthesis regulator phasin